MADLTRGIVPNSWRRYVLPPNLTVIQWMHDFAARVKQFAGIRESVHQRGIGTLRVYAHASFARMQQNDRGDEYPYIFVQIYSSSTRCSYSLCV